MDPCPDMSTSTSHTAAQVTIYDKTLYNIYEKSHEKSSTNKNDTNKK